MPKKLTSDDLLAACCLRYAMTLPECSYVAGALDLAIWADTTILAPLMDIPKLEHVINTWPYALNGKDHA